MEFHVPYGYSTVETKVRKFCGLVGRDIFDSLLTGYGKSVILVELVLVVSRQSRPPISDAKLASLLSNTDESGARALINTHRPTRSLVALVNLRPVNCSRPSERCRLYCKRLLLLVVVLVLISKTHWG